MELDPKIAKYLVLWFFTQTHFCVIAELSQLQQLLTICYNSYTWKQLEQNLWTIETIGAVLWIISGINIASIIDYHIISHNFHDFKL